MRVVGGKIGPDGQMFASIVWTVPGGPAEKSGLQQGDKVRTYVFVVWAIALKTNCYYTDQVLEWAGVPLANRSFEEVCSIIDRSGDVVELLVEQGYELWVGFRYLFWLKKNNNKNSRIVRAGAWSAPLRFYQPNCFRMFAEGFVICSTSPDQWRREKTLAKLWVCN